MQIFSICYLPSGTACEIYLSAVLSTVLFSGVLFFFQHLSDWDPHQLPEHTAWVCEETGWLITWHNKSQNISEWDPGFSLCLWASHNEGGEWVGEKYLPESSLSYCVHSDSQFKRGGPEKLTCEDLALRTPDLVLRKQYYSCLAFLHYTGKEVISYNRGNNVNFLHFFK